MKNKAAIASGHPETTRVAKLMLEQGGNAFDACVAAFFMACMAEPVLASLGGGGFLIGKNQSEDPFALDFFVQTPKSKKDIDELDIEKIVVDFGSTTQPFHIGYGCVAVPGCVKGMFEIHRRYCTMPMKDLMEPAIQAAKNGIAITQNQALILELVKPIYINRETARTLFVNSQSGDVINQSDQYINPDFAQTLEALATEGEALFYEGEIAQKIHQTYTNHGGVLGRDDLNEYQLMDRQPLKGTFHNANYYLNPPPSAGGMLVQFALQQFLWESQINFQQRDKHFYLKLANAIELTQQARVEGISKSSYQELEYDHLYDPILLKKYRNEIANEHKCNRGTTHISVIDAKGNVAAMTVSNGEGCGEILSETGIMLNNMLGEDDLSPMGLNQWSQSRRLSSMMCPGIAITNDKIMALGSGGSNRIRTAVLQVLINYLLSDLSLRDSVEAARMHYDDKLYIEPTGMSKSDLTALNQAYPDSVLFPGRDFYFGGVNAVAVGQSSNNSMAEAVADLRRGGHAVVL